jgi:hypothetical protein
MPGAPTSARKTNLSQLAAAMASKIRKDPPRSPRAARNARSTRQAAATIMIGQCGQGADSRGRLGATLGPVWSHHDGSNPPIWWLQCGRGGSNADVVAPMRTWWLASFWHGKLHVMVRYGTVPGTLWHVVARPDTLAYLTKFEP